MLSLTLINTLKLHLSYIHISFLSCKYYYLSMCCQYTCKDYFLLSKPSTSFPNSCAIMHITLSSDLIAFSHSFLTSGAIIFFIISVNKKFMFELIFTIKILYTIQFFFLIFQFFLLIKFKITLKYIITHLPEDEVVNILLSVQRHILHCFLRHLLFLQEMVAKQVLQIQHRDLPQQNAVANRC